MGQLLPEPLKGLGEQGRRDKNLGATVIDDVFDLFITTR